MEGLRDLTVGIGIDGTYVQQGMDSIRARSNLLRTLLSERRLPMIGWSDQSIEFLLHQLSIMVRNASEPIIIINKS